MPPTKGVQVKLDRQRTLRYTNSALVALEERTGQTLGEIGQQAQAGSLRAISSLVWAGLLHSDPDLELAIVIDRIELSRLSEIGDAVARAIESAFGTATESDEPESGKAPDES